MYSAGLVTAVLLISIGVFGGLDAVFRIQEAGWHYVFLGLTICLVGAVVALVVVPLLRVRLEDVDIARRIEKIYPDLKDRLSSSLAFLRQSDVEPTAGSAELRRTVITRMLSEYTCVNPDEVVDPRPAYRMCLAASLLFLMCFGFSVWQPTNARLALRHLLMPWRENAWPRQHDLAFVGAQVRAARGTDIEFVVVDRNGQLPAAVQLLVWEESTDESEIRPIEMVYRGGKMVCRVERVEKSFWYRAVGGDDDSMKWHPLDVVEPAGIADLAVRVTPPDYTGLPVLDFDDSFTAWEGSQIDVEGRATKPLSAATLNWQSAASQGALPLDVATPNDGASTSTVFSTSSRKPWYVYESGSYWLELLGPKNIVGGRDRWPLRVLLDRPPSLSLMETLSSSDVTPTAIIPIRLSVNDELAVRRVELRYSRSDRPQQPEVAQALFVGPKGPRVALAATDSFDPRPDRQQIDTRWDLSLVDGLAPGVTLMMRLTASDYKPQEGEIPPRRINVISAAEKQSQIVQRQTSILGRLGQVVQTQRDVRDDVRSLGGQIATKALGRGLVDRLRSLELRQRAVHERLSLDPESIRVQVRQLLREIEANRIRIPAVQWELEGLRSTLTRLSRESLGRADSLLTRSAKMARASDTATKASGDLAHWLTETDSHQQRVVDALTVLVERMKQWEGYQQFIEDIRTIAQQQQGLLTETRALRSRLMIEGDANSETEDGLIGEQLARRELELSRRLHRLQERVEQAAALLRQKDPQAAAALSGAAGVARENALGGRMREVSRQIRDRQLGQATVQQSEIVDGLRQVERRLSDGGKVARSEPASEQERQHSLDALDQQIARLESVVSMLKDRQERINNHTAELAERAKSPSDATNLTSITREVSEQQQTLAEDTTELAGQIGTLPAFVLALRRAADYMEVAASSLDQQGLQGQFARPQAAALESLKQILLAINPLTNPESLGDDPSSTAGTPNARPSQKASASRQELQLLRIMQQQIARRTIEIDANARQQGTLDAAQREDVVRLAKQQADLADVVRQLASAASDDEKTAVDDQKPPVDDKSSDAGDVESQLRESLRRVSWIRNSFGYVQMTQEFARFVIAGIFFPVVFAVTLQADESRGDEQTSSTSSMDELLLQDLDRELIGTGVESSAPARQSNRDVPATAGEDLARDSQRSDVLPAIERQMREVEQRMQQERIAAETQRLQQQIISQLDRLIQEIGTDPRQSSPKSSREQNATAEKQSAANSAAADDSTDRLAGQSTTPVDGRSMDSWLKKAWGHLPARLRTPMLNSGVEEFLPQYQALIEDYYRRLAEQQSDDR